LRVARFTGRGKLRVAGCIRVNKQYLGKMCSVLHSKKGKNKEIKKAQGIAVHYLLN
jgi:hypothetical protein